MLDVVSKPGSPFAGKSLENFRETLRREEFQRLQKDDPFVDEERPILQRQEV